MSIAALIYVEKLLAIAVADGQAGLVSELSAAADRTWPGALAEERAS